MTSLKKYSVNLQRLTGIIILLLFSALAIPKLANGQPVWGAENIALGGGGTAYLSGYEATFWNPANLVLTNRPGTLHFGIGQVGILYEPVLSSDAADDQFFNFTDSFYPYKPSATQISLQQRDVILDKNYPRNSLTSQHQTRADIILGGITWQRGNKAYSIAARARFASRIEVGRGWYSGDYISSGNKQVRSFTLNQQISQFYELSFGYGQEFTFINGLFSRLNELYVGIAPKVVISGPSFDATYSGRYLRSSDGSSETFVYDFFYRSTGQYSKLTNDYQMTSDPREAINRRLDKRIDLKPTGYGLGFDLGLTYLIPLGDDLSLIDDRNRTSASAKSVRIAFSVNDIGMVRYFKNTLKLSSPEDTLQVAPQPAKESMFIGAGGQYLSYLDAASALPNPILQTSNESTASYSALLPASLNAGVLLNLSRFKVMGDLTLGLSNTAFTSTKLMVHAGIEARPLKSIPIRLGTRIASGLPTHLGMGTGFETRYWDLNIGAQIILRSRTFTSEFVGTAFAGIQLHL